MSELDLAPEADATFHEKPDNQWLEMWRSLVANRAALVSLIFIGFLVFIAVFGPYLVPYNPVETDMAHALKPPSAQHWFGTEQLGMDIFSRVIVGARVSLTVGILAVMIAMTVGVILGSIAGYVGGRVDTVIMRVMDVMLAIPSILLAITLMAALGKGIDKAVIAIGLVSIPEYARIVRSNTLSIKENDYVAAARMVGNSNIRIIFRHVLPNALSVIIVRTTLGMSSAILDLAALGFLGMGVQPPQAEWGDMLGRARGFIFQAPWTLVFPGMAITLTVLAFNLLGDGLRDAFDPKSRVKSGRAMTTTANHAAIPEETLARPTGGAGGAAEASARRDVLLQVNNLSTDFHLSKGTVHAVIDVTFSVHECEVLAIVGESGSGKSVTALSVMGLLEPPGRVAGGEVIFRGRNLLTLSKREMRDIRGNQISMIFQEPMTSLNPVFTVENQLTESIRAHLDIGRKDANKRAIEMLHLVGIPDPEKRIKDYPHQMSGGMRQRVMTAMALSCDPQLLIADEPTTALDVTIQAQILALISELREKIGMSVLLITHDLGVVAETADRVIVMYCGYIVEEANAQDLFERPLHPYTLGLLESLPTMEDTDCTDPLCVIPGMVPNPLNMPKGCAFAERCGRRTERCDVEVPDLYEVEGRTLRCFHFDPAAADSSSASETGPEGGAP